MMEILYDNTKELKGDGGIVSCVNPMMFHSLDELKYQIIYDLNNCVNGEYHLVQVFINFNNEVYIEFSRPARLDIYYAFGDTQIRIYKDEHADLFDFLHNLDTYANYGS